MARRKSEHYVNNKEFLEAIVVYRNKCFAAEEAVVLGLISKSVSAEKLDEAVEEEISELLHCAPEAVSATKILIAEVRGKEPDDVRSLTVEKLANAWESESIKEGIEAFFSKRKPAWDHQY